MQPFRILYFRQSILRRADSADGDLLEVIDQATEHRSDETAEIWSDIGKVGIVAPLPRQMAAQSGGQSAGPPEAEIAVEMKQRLDLAQERTGQGRR